MKVNSPPQTVLERGRPLSVEAAARAMGIVPGTLRNWRSAGTGPRSHKVGSKIVFFESDVDAYLASCASDADPD